MSIALSETGEVAGRTTEYSGYPLPPLPPRLEVNYDGYGRYKLPSLTTGRPTGFTRATTVAGTLDDTYNLNQWKRREIVKYVLQFIGALDGLPEDAPMMPSAPERVTIVDRLKQALLDEDKRTIDHLLETINNVSGGRDAAELGTAVHAWIEAVDIGQVRPADVPEMFQPYLDAYQEVLRRHGLIAVPEYVERIVLNDRGRETVVGTLDRIYRVASTGVLILGDVKTSKTLEYGYLTYGIQLAVYGYATHMLGLDHKTWEPMPPMLGLSEDEIEEGKPAYGVIVHVPSDQPERSSAVTMDLPFSAGQMVASLDVRWARKAATKAVPFVHALPTPTPEGLRHVEAYQAIQNISDPADLDGVWEQYEDVWTDDLTQLGNRTAALF